MFPGNFNILYARAQYYIAWMTNKIVLRLQARGYACRGILDPYKGGVSDSSSGQ